MKPDSPALVEGGGSVVVNSKSRLASKRQQIARMQLVFGGIAIAVLVLVGGIAAVLMTSKSGPEQQATVPAGVGPGRAVQVATESTEKSQPKIDNEDAHVPKGSGGSREGGGISNAERGRWTSLFNGKDLSGWQPLGPEEPNAWKIQDGILVGQSDKWASLRSVRADFSDFHLRVEAIVNSSGGGSVRFRCPIEGKQGPFYAQLGNEGRWQTGSLLRKVSSTLHGPWQNLVEVSTAAAPANTWFILEVIAVGDRITLKVNGKTTADVRQADQQRSGYFILYPEKGSGISYRKIEIKELPAESKPVAVANPFAEKSVWVGTGAGNVRQVLTVTERTGDKFRARFEVGAKIERDVSGTIKDGKVSWLAKDLRAVSGGVGGDNQGTLGSDKDGDKIDFEWQDSKGANGKFVLRLSKEPVVKPASPPPPRVEDLIGTWNSDFGKVNLETTKAGVVTGSWIQANNKKGFITAGTFTPGTRNLTFSITQPWNNEKGSATFTLSADGSKLDGTWKHLSGNGKWQMTRVGK